MGDIEYIIAGDTLTCGKCLLKTRNPDDVYFRRCPYCRTMLGPEIRQRWNDAFQYAQLKDLCDTYGRYKQVRLTVDRHNQAVHAVPTERIITEGLKGTEVGAFPLWNHSKHHTKTGLAH